MSVEFGSRRGLSTARQTDDARIAMMTTWSNSGRAMSQLVNLRVGPCGLKQKRE